MTGNIITKMSLFPKYNYLVLNGNNVPKDAINKSINHDIYNMISEFQYNVLIFFSFESLQYLFLPCVWETHFILYS